MTVSVVIPAHNEESLLPRCLRSIQTAAGRTTVPVEIVLVDNRCKDATATIARENGAAVVECAARNIARVRNTGVAASTGDVVVTLDADCVMSPDAIVEVVRQLESGRYVGGGAKVVPERRSLGIDLTYALVALMTAATGLSGGMFWCARRDFDAIDGFDDSLVLAEDLDFARRLRAHGCETNRRLMMLRAAPVVASTRKFDRYGDWHMFKMAGQLPAIRRAARGDDTSWVDRYFFDFNSHPE